MFQVCSLFLCVALHVYFSFAFRLKGSRLLAKAVSLPIGETFLGTFLFCVFIYWNFLFFYLHIFLHSTGAWFLANEFVKRKFIPEGGTAADVGPLPLLLAGGCAGIANWLAVYPFPLYPIAFLLGKLFPP